ncbi:MAG: tetratricopeptide repeat protein [Promethearchaeota archaeon]
MSDSTQKDLVQIKELIDESKYNEALDLMKIFEEKGEYSVEDLIKCHLLKCELLGQRGLYNEARELANQAYEKSLSLGNPLLTIDTLLSLSKTLPFLGYQDTLLKTINQIEKLLEFYPQKESNDFMQRKATIFALKSFLDIYSVDQQLKFREHCLSIRKKIGSKVEIVEAYTYYINHVVALKGEIDRALKLTEQTYNLAQEINNKFWIGFTLINFMLFYKIKGEFDKSLDYCKQSMALFEEIGNKRIIGGLLSQFGEIYRMKGDLDIALEYAKQGLSIREKTGIPVDIATALGISIDLAVEMNEIDLAKQYLSRLKELDDRKDSQWIHIMYLSCKASILKTSPRAKNRAEAEDILKWIIEEGERGGIKSDALIGLCDLLLIELRMTNDIKVLDELDQYIHQLVELSESSNSFYLLAETCLLQAKLSLITLDMNEARRFLTQGQKIAERHGYNQLAVKLSKEHENLINQLDIWKEIKTSEVILAERIEMAKIGEQMEGMIRNRKTLLTQIFEEKVEIHKEQKICLVCKGQALGFTYICDCGAIYCENCALALSNLENICWVCDSPIDKSKPIKPYQTESPIIEPRNFKKK